MSLGPPLEVETTSEETESWFSSIVFQTQDAAGESSTSWWQSAATDSPLGILVSVKEPVLSLEQNARPRVTELLLYAAKSENSHTTRPLTPPESRPAQGIALADDAHHLRVYALPLSSELSHDAPNAEPTPPASPQADVEDIEPTFLPQASSKSTDSREIINRPPVRKRRNVNEAFDEATERQRKARRKGGESVAAAAAMHVKSEDSLPTLKHRRSVSNNQIPLQSRPLSRSSSVASARPTGLREASLSAVSKPSGLSRTESISGALESHVEVTVEQKNKDLVSKMVMTGMRLFGLHQSKSRKSRTNSAAPSPAVDVSFEEVEAEKKNDEEFKLTYHQVYKGTCFAMRQHIPTLALQPHTEALRDTVDKLLAVFCNDPLTSSGEGPGEEYTPGGRKAFGPSALPASNQGNPFLQAAIMGSDSVTNTPSLKSARATREDSS